MMMTEYAKRARPATDEQTAKIEEYRKLLRGSNDGTGERDMSYGELADLQGMAAQGVIELSDLEMLEAAGVSEWEATGYGEGNPAEANPYYEQPSDEPDEEDPGMVGEEMDGYNMTPHDEEYDPADPPTGYRQ